MQWLVVLSAGVTKLSVLLLYKRIFKGKVFDVCTWILLFLSLTWTISFFFGNLRKVSSNRFPSSANGRS